MNQEATITFQGLNLATPPDTCPDGQLASCLGLEMHQGVLRPAMLDGTRYTLPPEYEGATLKALHTTANYNHFIFLAPDQKTLYWSPVTEGQLQANPPVLYHSPVTDIKTLGNTLMALTADGIVYSLFKEGEYKKLGTKPPETVINFDLISWRYKASSEYVINHMSTVHPSFEAEAWDEETYIELRDEYKSELTLKENAMVAKFISEATDANRIIYPVMVRYAYRLYDGTSYIMQSAPVLLVPNTDVAPATLYRASRSGYGIDSRIGIEGNVSDIIYNVIQAELQDWKDIITSVDIFMSEQIYTRKTDEKITHVTRFSTSDAAKSTNYGYFIEQTDHYGPKTFWQARTEGATVDTDQVGYLFTLTSPDIKKAGWQRRLVEESRFYKVRSIPVEEIQAGQREYLFKEKNEDGISLHTINLQEPLPDDYQSHDVLIPGNAFVYNSRLNMADITRHLFQGYDTAAMVANVQKEDSPQVYYHIYTHIKKDNREIVVRNTPSALNSFYPLFLYYPDPDAYLMTIVKSTTPELNFEEQMYSAYSVPLSKHAFLHGAYFFDGFKAPERPSRNFYPPELTPSVVSEPNKMATSEVGNPFFFPLAGRNTVGISRILALSTIVTPLSQGQFGQYPLMIFTAEGNYAASVTDEGLYSAINPMQGDVCTLPSRIVPTERNIIFISAKGAMTAVGNDIACISEELRGLHGSSAQQPYPVPEELLQRCIIAYDYTGRRLIFAGNHTPYAYIRSEDGIWSMAQWGEVIQALNVYPFTYIQQADGIVRLDTPYNYQAQQPVDVQIETRPVKLGSIQYKKMIQIKLEGSLPDDVQITLYGSQDNRTWHQLGTSVSSRIGHPSGRLYKFWKYKVQASLNASHHITGLRITYTPRIERRYR